MTIPPRPYCRCQSSLSLPLSLMMTVLVLTLIYDTFRPVVDVVDNEIYWQ